MSEILKIIIGGDTSQYDAALKEIKERTKGLESELVSVGKKSAIAFAAFGGAIGLAVNQAAKFETITTQFEVLTGSVQGARDVMKDLSDFSASTPFEFEGIAKAGQQLLGFGFHAKNLKPLLSDIGDVAAASGKPIDEMALIFGQVAAAGKLTGERLLQFQERAIPIGPALAETMGIAETSVRDMVTKGKVDFETFQKAFSSMAKEGGFAFGGLEKQSKTTAGALSNLGDNFSLLTAEVGKHFLPVINAVAAGTAKFLDVIRNNAALAKTAALVLSLGAAATGLTAVFAFGTVGLLKFRAAMQAAILAVRAMQISVKGLMAATGIGLLIVVLADLAVNWEKRWDQMRAVFSGFANNISQIGRSLSGLLQGIFTFDKDQIVKNFQDLKAAISGTFTEIGENLDKIDLSGASEEASAAADEQVRIASETNEQLVKLREERNERIKELQMDLARAEFEGQLDLWESIEEMELEHQITMQEIKNEARNLELQVAQELREQEAQADLEEKKRQITDEQKHGKVVAQMKATFRKQEYKATQEMLDNLATLSHSNNKTLVAIAKTAAIARAIMNVAEGVTKAIAQGGFLGLAMGASVAAAGAVQISKIQSMGYARGGLVEGGIPGVDSVPALLQQGELVAPRKNFDEVVDAVARQRAMQSEGGESGGGGEQLVVVELSLKDEIMEFIETRIVERRRLGVALV